MGLLDSPVGSHKPQQAPIPAHVAPIYQNAIPYQTMSDFEVKLLAEVRQLRDSQDKMFNMLSNIVIGMGDTLNKDAMEIHAMDDHSTNLENVGLKPKSHLDDIPLIEDSTEEIQF